LLKEFAAGETAVTQYERIKDGLKKSQKQLININEIKKL
jgi:hypothetical protein